MAAVPTCPRWVHYHRRPDVVLDTEHAGHGLDIRENGTTVRQLRKTKGFDGAWVLAVMGISKGMWRFKFSPQRREGWMGIGFTLSSIDLNKPLVSGPNSYFIYASTGNLKQGENLCVPDEISSEGDADWMRLAKPYAQNDVVQAHLNMDEGTLFFSLNNTSPILAYKNLSGRTLYPAIYLTSYQDEVNFQCEEVLPDPVKSPDFTHLLDTDDLPADTVEFQLEGAIRSVRAHRFLLAARSEYFRALLESPLRRDCTEKVIRITGASYTAFVVVLRYLYSGGSADVPQEHVVDVFKLASEYTLQSLQMQCLEQMFENITPENVLSMFMLSEQYLPRTLSLKERCMDVIRDNIEYVTALDSFKELCVHPGLVKELLIATCVKRRRI